MKLIKWRCKTCGFGWVEPPSHADGHERGIDHGCPQACDDAGGIVARVKAVTVRTKR